MLFTEDDRDEVVGSLLALTRRGPYFDRACVLLGVCQVSGPPATGFVALVTRTQAHGLPEGRPPVRLALDNGRVVQTVDPDGPAASTLEYQGAEYLEGCGPEEAGDGELMLVTTPSSPFADRMHNRHSYFCLVHPEHASRVTTDYVYVRIPFFAVDFPGLRTAIPVRVIFDERVMPGRPDACG